MQARLLVPLRATPNTKPELIQTEIDGNGNEVKYVPAGTIIDHPDAFKLVFGGLAEAADEECQKAADRWKPKGNMKPGALRESHERIMAEHAEQVQAMIDDEDEDLDEEGGDQDV